MEQSWLYGAWTYRSFFNIVQPAEKLDDLVLAECEMTFDAAPSGEVRGQLAFRSDPPTPGDPRLTLSGRLEAGSPAAARFRGIGVPGTAAATWVYDYVGYLVPNWIGGKAQRTAMVGSVMRVVDHPGGDGSIHRAGETFSFVAVQRDFPEPRTVIGIGSPAREMLASRHHRLHHFVWHGLRNGWASDQAIPPSAKKRITQLGWAPPRPVLSAGGDPLFGNGSGEDFLFMHRQMIIEVNNTLKEAGAAAIDPWGTIPGPEPVVVEPEPNSPKLGPPGNPNGISVPTDWTPDDPALLQRLASLKSAEFYWSRMRWWDRQFKDPAYLSTLSLGELGTLLEWTVHNDMHMRWASVPRNPDTKEIAERDAADIRPLWDNPDYDHLGEQYSSHVNPVFWRLHGWVDRRIEDWFEAHHQAHPGEVKRATVMDTPWFRPGKWVQCDMPWSGKMDMRMSFHAGSKRGKGQRMGDGDIKDLEEIVRLIYGPPPGTKSVSAAVKRARAEHQRRHMRRF
jgi:hypothetical protein